VLPAQQRLSENGKVRRRGLPEILSHQCPSISTAAGHYNWTLQNLCLQPAVGERQVQEIVDVPERARSGVPEGEPKRWQCRRRKAGLEVNRARGARAQVVVSSGRAPCRQLLELVQGMPSKVVGELRVHRGALVRQVSRGHLVPDDLRRVSSVFLGPGGVQVGSFVREEKGKGALLPKKRPRS
jgi:hypothetical protein